MAHKRSRHDEIVDRERPPSITPRVQQPGSPVDARADVVRSMQRLAGNEAVTRWLGHPNVQRQDAGTAVATGTIPATAAVKDDPVADAKALIAEVDSLKTNAGMAGWLLKAHDQGFVTFTSGMKTQDNLESLRDGKKVGNADPKDTTIFGALQTMHALAAARINRWVADPTKAKESIQVGSFIRTGASAGRHGTGAAIDINQGEFTGSAGDVITVLKDLPQGSYGLGLPFQGDFFPPEKNLDTMKDAEKAKPAPGNVTGGLVKFTAHLYKAAYNGTTKAFGEPEVQSAGAAYTMLKSEALKTQLQAMRTAGTTLMIFPDNDNHLHVDTR
ncbi:MAG: hypothetical protein M3077_01815 [Candidatus Dormibacteraeota bacterium]|nr:hypothetical protein [Candidatus Dormibacteraeota bacterium]